jgi:uncharacterized protein YgiM (DUF1202 family)
MNRYIVTIVILSLAALACRASAGQAAAPVRIPAQTPTPNLQTATASPEVRVCAEVLNVRSQPDPVSPILGTLLSGMPVQLLAEQASPDGGAWAQINAQGMSGWVNTRYLCEK